MRKLLLLAAGVVTLVLPPLLPERQLSVFILLGLAATVTAGVSLLMGYAGQVSLGQAAFYAIGAYAAGLSAVHGVPSLVGLLLAPVVAAVAAVLLGAPLLRLRGHHLAFATLAVQLILLSLLGQGTWAGGAIGLQGIPRLSLGPLELKEDIGYAYVVWAVLAIVLLISRNVVASRPGRALRAAATSEIAAAASGVPVGGYRLAVFTLSAAFAGLAGGVYAFYLGYLAPGSFPVLLSIEFVVMAVVGGLGTIAGPLVGATVIVLLVQLLNELGTQPGMPSYAPSVLSYAVYALLLILAILYMPKGIVPALHQLSARLPLLRTPSPQTTPTPAPSSPARNAPVAEPPPAARGVPMAEPPSPARDAPIDEPPSTAREVRPGEPASTARNVAEEAEPEHGRSDGGVPGVSGGGAASGSSGGAESDSGGGAVSGSGSGAGWGAASGSGGAGSSADSLEGRA
ncbi:branched-chain amino acid ABC transporter permease [Actinoplanes sp. NPDC049596]|uniref:branched-chain amino acid ABC transporter permease n=1 Tax=unclassified Actinoplanes TaxID=2626549 RepID=UPI00343E1249